MKMLTLNQAVLCLSLIGQWCPHRRPLTNQENLKLKLNSKLILLVVQFTEHCVVRVSKCLARNKVLKSHIFIDQIQVCKFSSTCEYFAYLLSVEPSLVLMAYQKT